MGYKADVQTKYFLNPSWLAQVKELPEPYQTDKTQQSPLLGAQVRSVKIQTSSTTCSDTLQRGDTATPIPKPAEGSEILTEAANCCNVMCGKCNERGVEGLVLLLVVQDFGFTAKKVIQLAFIQCFLSVKYPTLLQTLPYLILIAAPLGRHCYHPYVQESEAQPIESKHLAQGVKLREQQKLTGRKHFHTHLEF